MATIKSVRRMVDGRSADQDWNHHITYTDRWEVVTDGIATEQEVAGDNVTGTETGDVTVPVNGDPFTDNNYAVCTDRHPEMSGDSPYIWYINCTYKTHPDAPAAGTSDGTGGIDTGLPGTDTGLPGKVDPNPLLQPAKWRLGMIDRTEPVTEWRRVDMAGRVVFIDPPAWVANTKYKSGKYVKTSGNVYFAVQVGEGTSGTLPPVGKGDANETQLDGTVVWAYWSTIVEAANDPNSAIHSACMHSGKLPFDPPAMTDVSIPTIIVTKNIASINLPWFMSLKNAVNSVLWRTVIPPQCAKVLKVSAGNEYTEINKMVYVTMETEIGLDPETWDLRLLDQGYGNYGMRTVPKPGFPTTMEQKMVFTRFKDPDNNDIGSPVPMDGNGGRLNPEDDPVYLRGIPRQQRLLDFNQIFLW